MLSSFLIFSFLSKMHPERLSYRDRSPEEVLVAPYVPRLCDALRQWSGELKGYSDLTKASLEMLITRIIIDSPTVEALGSHFMGDGYRNPELVAFIQNHGHLAHDLRQLWYTFTRIFHQQDISRAAVASSASPARRISDFRGKSVFEKSPKRGRELTWQDRQKIKNGFHIVLSDTKQAREKLPPHFRLFAASIKLTFWRVIDTSKTDRELLRRLAPNSEDLKDLVQTEPSFQKSIEDFRRYVEGSLNGINPEVSTPDPDVEPASYVRNTTRDHAYVAIAEILPSATQERQ